MYHVNKALCCLSMLYRTCKPELNDIWHFGKCQVESKTIGTVIVWTTYHVVSRNLMVTTALATHRIPGHNCNE